MYKECITVRFFVKNFEKFIIFIIFLFDFLTQLLLIFIVIYDANQNLLFLDKIFTRYQITPYNSDVIKLKINKQKDKLFDIITI